MTRFYFDLCNGFREPDLRGVELANRSDAAKMAVRYLAEVARDEPERLNAGTIRVDVREMDGSGRFSVVLALEPLSGDPPTILERVPRSATS